MKVPTPDDILTDYRSSFWIKNALAAAMVRDPVEALADAQLLVRVLWHQLAEVQAAGRQRPERAR